MAEPETAPPPARLELVGMTKSFPGVLACDHVDFAVAPGSIHALLGENGSGKSTIVKMVYGVLRPDDGAMMWNGREVTVADPRAARAMGVGMVFQHFSLFDALTALENIALGFDDAVPAAELEQRVRAILDGYGLQLDIHRRVHDLSAGERQRIEIVRALLGAPQLLIMDEPTSVLTPGEAESLFESLRTLVSQGCAILYISHKLREVQALCDDATILRAGRVVARCDPRSETSDSMAAMMIGADAPRPSGQAMAAKGPARLVVDGLGGDDVPGLDAVSFQLAGGEILGVAGIAGNGQNALLAAMTGETPAQRAETIRFDGQPVGRLGPEARRAMGLRGVPEERNGDAAGGAVCLTESALQTGRGGF
ncbi:MAG: ATP-binding cassette domain-containing protein, partial [Pseudomonadota bacterium]